MMSDEDDIASSWSASKGSNSGYSSGAETDDFLGSFDCAEDELLYVSRHGRRTRLLSMLVASEEADEGDKININCKGNQKSNRGWSPLHLAVYFGQVPSVRLLLEFGANVNQLNAAGESPLHLAAYTGREEIVGLLLQHGADTTLYNTAGQTAKSVARSEYILNMIAGLTALDLCQSEKMRQVLAVQPIRTLHSQPQRFEGFLLKQPSENPAEIRIQYSDGIKHTLQVESAGTHQMNIQICFYSLGDLVHVVSQANDIVRSSREMCNALNHCMALLAQQEEVSSSPC
ncbi:oxysterol-binding protein [Elysia marginata]|uniref:Oxysterol-binding protein n=1 Tax=Elysia marginata TaxID=1093978 RepID=A0AAV4G2M9_9GAST|nr:oxysterol-binding protein [Elysia marginata]